jgi:hypothetical protein
LFFPFYFSFFFYIVNMTLLCRVLVRELKAFHCPFGIRLEDYTGQSLGTLPQDHGYDDKSEDESGDERFDYDDNDEDDHGELNQTKRSLNGRGVSPLPQGNGRTMELARLFEECRVMNEGCGEEMMARIRPTLTTDESD